MSKILFICSCNPLHHYNYSLSVGWNSGDLAYIYATLSYIFNKNLSIITLDRIDEMILDKTINAYISQFKLAIINDANIFADFHKSNLNRQIKRFNNIKIPLYVLGAGAQSDINYSFDFIKDIRDDIKRYMDSLLATGGGITLRGYFTKEVLSQLGYKDLFVSGCPSMYFNLDSMYISNNKVSLNVFKPIFNGSIKDNYDGGLKKYKNSLFFDQDEYYKLLWHSNNIDNKYIRNITSSELIDTYRSSRLRSYREIQAWMYELKNSGISFSYGQRIHGNILPLLCGIPSFLDVIDSRTREIADFYNIPNSFDIKFNIRKDNLYDLYKGLDFSDFNSIYKKRLFDFKQYLYNNKIINYGEINNNNSEYIRLNSVFEFQKLNINPDLNVMIKLKKELRIKLCKKLLKIFLYFFINFIPIQSTRHYLRKLVLKKLAL